MTIASSASGTGQIGTNFAPGIFVKAYLPHLFNTKISGEAHRLLLVLQHYGRNGDCRPSQARLAHDLNKSERQIQRLLAELETEGLIEPQARPGQTNRYWLSDATPAALVKSEPIQPQAHPHQAQPTPDRFVVPTTTNLSYKEELNNKINSVCESAAHNTKQSQAEAGTGHIPQTDLNAETPDRQENTEYTGYVTLLQNSGVATAAARRLVDTAAANRPGQVKSYLTGWIEVARTKKNPAGYLKTVISDNADLPTKPANRPVGVKGHQPRLSSSRRAARPGQANPIDFSKYQHLQEPTASDDTTTSPADQLDQAQPSQPVRPAQIEPQINRPTTGIDARLGYSLAEFDQQSAARLCSLEIDGDTIRARFAGNFRPQSGLEAWLPLAQIYYPQARCVQVVEWTGRLD